MFLDFERAQPGLTLPLVLLEASEGRSGLVDEGSDVGDIGNDHVMALSMLGVGEFSGVRGRLTLRFLEAALVIFDGDA